MAEPESDTGELVRRLDEIEEYLDSEITREREDFTDIKQSIERIDELVHDLESHLLHNESLEHDREIEEILNTLRGDLTAFHEGLEDISQSWHKVESTQAQIRSIRDAIASVVEGGLDTKIVAEFQNRTDELEKSLKWWKFWTICSVVALFLSSGFIYLDISRVESSTLILSKSLLLLPIFVVLWFSIHQYNRHKMLIEQYEFKTSMADSLMGFREILKQDFSDENQERVGEFVIDTVDRMYSDPGTNITGNNEQISKGDGGMPRSNADLVRRLINK